jgi:ribose transport system permease protein
MTAILALGQTFVIITAGIDLSVGAIVGFCRRHRRLAAAGGRAVWAAILLTLLFGVAIGAFHGFGIVHMGLPPFIITLATLTALRGYRPADHQRLDDQHHQRGLHQLLARRFPRHSEPVLDGHPGGGTGLHLPASQPLGPLSLRGRLQQRSRAPFRRQRQRIIYMAYILSATFAAFVGVLLASRIAIGNATQADGWELQAIASSVIGGTSLFGAVGSVHGPLIGAFILATINNGANLLNVNSFWQRIITGC